MEHLRIRHPDVENPFECSFCEKFFKVRKNLKYHILSVHEKKKPHLCPFCGKSFLLQNPLKKHIEAIHEKKMFKCEICAEEFKTVHFYRTHKSLKHEGKIGSTFKCDLCDHETKTKGGLLTHVRTVHEGAVKKSFVCATCGAVFKTKVGLTSHTNTVHEGRDSSRMSYEKSAILNQESSIHPPYYD